MDHGKDVLALLENMQNQIQKQEQQIHDLKQAKDAQQQQILDEKQQRHQQIFEEKQQRQQQAQQLEDELHEFKASSSKKPLAEKSSLMKNVFILITFLYVCNAVLAITDLVGSLLGFQDSLALQLLNYFFGYGVQLFSLGWSVCFAPSPKWLLSLFIYLSLLNVVSIITDVVTVNVFGVVESVVSLIIFPLLAWQHQSVWRIFSARPLEQATLKLFLSLFRTFVYLSIPIVAISIRDQELNDYAGDAINYFSLASLGLVLFVRLKIRNNETLLQLLFRLNHKEQFVFCILPIACAIFLIHYVYYLSNSVESSVVQQCLIIISLVLALLVVFFVAGTISKWRYLSWFDIDSPVAVAASEESNAELSHPNNHVTIDF